MSDEEGATGELLGVISRRRALLERLHGGTWTKRDLVGEVEASRSTVDRALRRLEALNLVSYEGGGYRLSLSGRLALGAYDQFAARAESVVAAGDLVSHLPPDAPVAPSMLTDAELVLEGAKKGPTEVLRERLSRAGRVRALARVYDETLSEGLLPRSMAGEAEVDVLLSRRGVESANGADGLRRAGEAGVVRRVESAPYGLFVLGDGEEACLAVYDRENNLRGVMRNDAPRAVSWADDLLAEYDETARPVSR
jgi:predicted transcriptional regulator